MSEPRPAPFTFVYDTAVGSDGYDLGPCFVRYYKPDFVPPDEYDDALGAVIHAHLLPGAP